MERRHAPKRPQIKESSPSGNSRVRSKRLKLLFGVEVPDDGAVVSPAILSLGQAIVADVR